MTQGVVDAATAKFTLLEQQVRNQQELTQGVIQAAKTQFDEVKRVVDNTTEGILASVCGLGSASESNNLKVMLEGLRYKIRPECLK